MRFVRGAQLMAEDTSMEFDMFEEIRRRLVEILLRDGRSLLEAERVALYVTQGVRGVPKLLMALTDVGPEADKKVLDILYTVLDNASALIKARNILFESDEDTGPEE